MDIISMAQQARPNPNGQMELLRAQFTALSSVVKIMPSSSSSLPKSSGLVSVTCLPRDTLIVTSRVFSHRASGDTNGRPHKSLLLLVARFRSANPVSLIKPLNALCRRSFHFLRIGGLKLAEYAFRNSEIGIHKA